MVFEQTIHELKGESNQVLHTKLYKLKVYLSLSTSLSQMMNQVEKMRQKELFVKDRLLCLKFVAIF